MSPLHRDNDEERQARIEHMLDTARAAHQIAEEAHEAATRRFRETERRLSTTKARLDRVEERLRTIAVATMPKKSEPRAKKARKAKSR
jgi:hypothetical protein